MQYHRNNNIVDPTWLHWGALLKGGVLVFNNLYIIARSGPGYPRHPMPLALVLPRGDQCYPVICAAANPVRGLLDYDISSGEGRRVQDRPNKVMTKSFIDSVRDRFLVVDVCITFTAPLRIQPWSQDRRDQTESNREYVRRKAGKADRRYRPIFHCTTLQCLVVIMADGPQRCHPVN